MVSWSASSSLANSITGREAVRPWLPLPETITTGQAAAVHPGVGTGGCLGFGPDLHIVPIGGQQHLADVGAVVPPQALLGDGGVQAHLPEDGFLYVGKISFPGKFQNTLHAEHGPVSQALIAGSLGYQGFFLEHLAVFLYPHQVGVVVRNAHQGLFFPVPGTDEDVKNVGGICQLHGNGVFFRYAWMGGLFCLPSLGEHFQLQVRVAHGHACRRSRGDAPQPAVPGTNTLFTFLIMFPLASTSMRSARAPKALWATAAA